jgi:hypothetical protein
MTRLCEKFRQTGQRAKSLRSSPLRGAVSTNGSGESRRDTSVIWLPAQNDSVKPLRGSLESGLREPLVRVRQRSPLSHGEAFGERSSSPAIILEYNRRRRYFAADFNVAVFTVPGNCKPKRNRLL